MASSSGPVAASTHRHRTILPTTESRADHVELRGLLAALRRELWWRQSVGTVLLAVAVGALVAAVLAWLVDARIGLLVLGLAILAGAGLALSRQPGVARAALRADRELDLANRLGTANEILAGRINGSLSA